MQPQWSKERFSCKHLEVGIQFNDVMSNQFYNIVKADSTQLKKVKETAKYLWAKSKN